MNVFEPKDVQRSFRPTHKPLRIMTGRVFAATNIVQPYFTRALQRS